MSATKEFDVEIWKRNLRAAPGAPLPDEEACTRWFNNYFAFWLVCETKACKRTKRCAGNAGACRDRFMPLVPQRMKFELQVTLKAVNDRLPLEGVTQRVKEEMARFDETTRMLEQLDTSGAGAPQASLSPRPAQRGEGGEPQARLRALGGDPLPAKGRPRPSSTGYAGEGKASARGPRVRMC